MSDLARRAWRTDEDHSPTRIFLSVLWAVSPALAGGAIAAICAALGVTSTPDLLLGAGVAFGLLAVGGLAVALAGPGSLTVAAGAAMFSFLIRFGGAGLAAYLLRDAPGITAILAMIAACLGASLLLDLARQAIAVRRSSLFRQRSVNDAAGAAHAG